jgi:hypothetical protein
MHAQETVLRREVPLPGARGISSVFPTEVLAQVRGRVRLLASLIFVAFALSSSTSATGRQSCSAFSCRAASSRPARFKRSNLTAALASAGRWWVAVMAAVASGAMSPLALLLLDITGTVTTDPDAYLQ